MTQQPQIYLPVTISCNCIFCSQFRPAAQLLLGCETLCGFVIVWTHFSPTNHDHSLFFAGFSLDRRCRASPRSGREMSTSVLWGRKTKSVSNWGCRVRTLCNTSFIGLCRSVGRNTSIYSRPNNISAEVEFSLHHVNLVCV